MRNKTLLKSKYELSPKVPFLDIDSALEKKSSFGSLLPAFTSGGGDVEKVLCSLHKQWKEKRDFENGVGFVNSEKQI